MACQTPFHGAYHKAILLSDELNYLENLLHPWRASPRDKAFFGGSIGFEFDLS